MSCCCGDSCKKEKYCTPECRAESERVYWILFEQMQEAYKERDSIAIYKEDQLREERMKIEGIIELKYRGDMQNLKDTIKSMDQEKGRIWRSERELLRHGAAQCDKELKRSNDELILINQGLVKKITSLNRQLYEHISLRCQHELRRSDEGYIGEKDYVRTIMRRKNKK